MIIIDNAKQRRHGLQFVIWWFAVKQFNDGAAQAPNVGRGRGTRQLNHLRRHPIRSAHDTRLRETRSFCSNSKVGEFDQALFRGEDICSLDVPVNHTLFMEVEKTVENLDDVQRDEILRELAKVLADGVQRTVLAKPVRMLVQK